MKEAELIPIDPVKRIKGKITKVDPTGFGFITSAEQPFTTFFFHLSALMHNTKHFTELKKGDSVMFEPIDFTDPITNEYKGWRGIKIEVI